MRNMREATDVLVNEMQAFNDQTEMLEAEMGDATEAFEVAERHLADHRKSRKLVLGELYKGLLTAIKAELGE